MNGDFSCSVIIKTKTRFTIRKIKVHAGALLGFRDHFCVYTVFYLLVTFCSLFQQANDQWEVVVDGKTTSSGVLIMSGSVVTYAYPKSSWLAWELEQKRGCERESENIFWNVYSYPTEIRKGRELRTQAQCNDQKNVYSYPTEIRKERELKTQAQCNDQKRKRNAFWWNTSQHPTSRIQEDCNKIQTNIWMVPLAQTIGMQNQTKQCGSCLFFDVWKCKAGPIKELTLFFFCPNLPRVIWILFDRSY